MFCRLVGDKGNVAKPLGWGYVAEGRYMLDWEIGCKLLNRVLGEVRFVGERANGVLVTVGS